MFRAEPMKHVRLHVMTESLPRVSILLAESESFNPDYRVQDEERLPGVPGRRYRDLCTQAASRLEKICTIIEIQPTSAPAPAQTAIAERDLELLNEWLGTVWTWCSSYQERHRGLIDELRLVEELEKSLETYTHLNIDLGLLEGAKAFVNLHIGMLPRRNLGQLREALALANHLLYEFLEVGEDVHVLIIGLRGEQEDELSSVLDTAGFRAVPIPPELHDEPGRIQRELSARRAATETKLAMLRQELERWSGPVRDRLAEAQQTLRLAAPLAELDTAARCSDRITVINGWVPARRVAGFTAKLDQGLGQPFFAEVRDPKRSENRYVPTIMHRGRWLYPFASLVRQYGVPRYGEIDPTIIFALTFVVLFGMMFGDIGHGLTIMLFAWFARRRLRRFTPFALMVGASSTLFGFLYGSVFGFEEVLPPLWLSPLSDPLHMLSAALAFGISFLVLITLINIYNRVAFGEFASAVFGNNSVLSITLYLSVLSGIYATLGHLDLAKVPWLVAFFCVLALAAYKWTDNEMPVGERVLVTLIETFETVTGYVSNTLSFLRVSAFALNHVALAIAVFSLAQRMDAAGHWSTLVLGNVLVLVLEGAIVIIQVLRLEYFEGFSRYFSGSGTEFRPLRLHAGAT